MKQMRHCDEACKLLPAAGVGVDEAELRHRGAQVGGGGRGGGRRGGRARVPHRGNGRRRGARVWCAGRASLLRIKFALCAVLYKAFYVA